MLDALYFCHVCKSVCFCLNQTGDGPTSKGFDPSDSGHLYPGHTLTSVYKFISVGTYDQSSKDSLQVRLKPGPTTLMRCYHGKDAWGPKMPDALMRGHHTMGKMPVGTNSCHATMENPWPLGDASQPDARCLREPWRGSCKLTQMNPDEP